MQRRWVIGSLAGAVLLLVALTGLWEQLSDPERLQETLRSSGFYGPALFVLLFSLLQPFGAPGVLLMLAAGLVWPLWAASGIVWVSAMGAGVVGFLFARTLGREWVQARLPERFRRYDERLDRRAVRTVALVRLVTFVTPPMHWALGLSSVRFPAFLLGSALGFIPGCLLIPYLSRLSWEGAGWFGDRSLAFWIILIAIGAALIVLRWLWSRRTGRADMLRGSSPPEEAS